MQRNRQTEDARVEEEKPDDAQEGLALRENRVLSRAGASGSRSFGSTAKFNIAR